MKSLLFTPGVLDDSNLPAIQRRLVLHFRRRTQFSKEGERDNTWFAYRNIMRICRIDNVKTLRNNLKELARRHIIAVEERVGFPKNFRLRPFKEWELKPSKNQIRDASRESTVTVDKDFFVSSEFDDSGLSIAESCVATHIQSRGEKLGCFDSIRTMARICRLKRETVRDALEQLELRRAIIVTVEDGRETRRLQHDFSKWTRGPGLGGDGPGLVGVPLAESAPCAPSERAQSDPCRNGATEVNPREVNPIKGKTPDRLYHREISEKIKKAEEKLKKTKSRAAKKALTDRISDLEDLLIGVPTREIEASEMEKEPERSATSARALSQESQRCAPDMAKLFAGMRKESGQLEAARGESNVPSQAKPGRRFRLAVNGQGKPFEGVYIDRSGNFWERPYVPRDDGCRPKRSWRRLRSTDAESAASEHNRLRKQLTQYLAGEQGAANPYAEKRQHIFLRLAHRSLFDLSQIVQPAPPCSSP